jgi:hypothetical protein
MIRVRLHSPFRLAYPAAEMEWRRPIYSSRSFRPYFDQTRAYIGDNGGVEPRPGPVLRERNRAAGVDRRGLRR